MTQQPRIHPVILSGGSGSRLWPLSRLSYPKQLLPLAGERTLIQETARRVSDPALFEAPLVICNDEHRFIIAEQLRRSGITPLATVLEPEGRNTAPAVAVAALLIAEQSPDGRLLVLPSDHVIADEAAFVDAVRRAAELAGRNRLVTFGIRPEGPETGYGYIRRGAALPGIADAFEVGRFVEKPDAEAAGAYVRSGEYAWNSGMFLLPARLVLAELDRLEPGLMAACRAALAAARQDLHFCRLDEGSFREAPSLSFDVAVMERTEAAAMVAADIGWSDVGSFDAMWAIAPHDADGNATSGDVLLEDVRNSLVRADRRLVAALGVADLVIVETDTAVLVADRARSQEVKRLCERLKGMGRTEAVAHRRVYRPWGFFEGVAQGERYQVKLISVNPGGQLSLQRHHHRAEHWVVVNGTARVVRGEETLLLQENQSTYIPPGVVHRLENPGKIQLNLIEVQSGAYLGEDDIVRIEDSYGRTAG